MLQERCALGRVVCTLQCATHSHQALLKYLGGVCESTTKFTRTKEDTVTYH